MASVRGREERETEKRRGGGRRKKGEGRRSGVAAGGYSCKKDFENERRWLTEVCRDERSVSHMVTSYFNAALFEKTTRTSKRGLNGV